MSAEDEAKHILMKMGLWWPDADSGKLRKAADAWRTFADAVDDVRGPVNSAARGIIHHNRGEAIEVFEKFWDRYAKGKDAGWLSDLSGAARKMAHALDTFADAVDDAVNKLETQIAIDAAVILAGIGLAIFTAGLSTAASAVAAEAIIELGGTLGIAVSTAVADLAAGTLVAAVFGGLESVTVDVAVAQPMKIAAGMQTGMSLDEINQAARDGMLYGAAFGAGFGVVKNGIDPALAESPFLARPPSLRPDLVELGPAARQAERTPCVGEPIDIATGAMLMTQTDLTLPAVGLPLIFQRTHLSSYRAGLCFGPTWISTLDECVQIDGEGVVFAATDGMRLVYPVPQPGQTVLPLKGARWPLEWDGKPDGVMTITDPATGVVRTFSTPLRSGTAGVFRLPVDSWHDRNNTRIDVERNHQGIPTALRHSGGYYLAIDTNGQRITALRLLNQAPSPYEMYGPAAATAGSVVMRYCYDEFGRLTEVINSSGQPLRFTNDDEGRVTSWTDRNGTSFAYIYDAGGRVERTEGSDGFLSGTLTYDDENRTTTYTDSLGHRSLHRYNAQGQAIEETNSLGHTTHTEWNVLGDKPLSVTDPLGNTTTYTYDDGNLTTTTFPDGSTAHARYNTFGQPVEVTDPGGAEWRHIYDDCGNLRTTTDPLGAETHYTYNAAGHLTTVTDALGHTSYSTPNAAGLPTSVTNALGHTTTIQRDAFGRITEVVDALGHVTRMGWTMEGKPAWRENPNGNRETWAWDGEGNLLTHTDPTGNVTQHTSGPFDVPATRTDPDGSTYTFAHDTELRLTSVTNPQGLTWTYTYDTAGRLTAETDFNGRSLTYTHDAAGRLVARTNGAGETLHFGRDVLGRVTRQWDEESSGDVTTYTYSATGSLICAANAGAEISFERDAVGRVLTEVINNRKITHLYDALGQRIRRTTPSGLISQWTYDPAGHPREFRSESGTVKLTYDATGREVERHIGNSTSLVQSWDEADRLTTQSLTRHLSSPAAPGAVATAPTAGHLLQHRTYAYRADGYLTEVRELTAGTRRFTLDTTGRVTGVQAHGWTETYAYDTTGNLTHATAPAHASPGDRSFDGTRLRRAGRTSYEYDGQGRLMRKTRRLLSGQKRVWTYVWGAEDRLTEILTPNDEKWRYTYDPLGRRISKQHLAEDGSVVGRTDFDWDSTRLAEQRSSGTTVTTWDYVPGTHHPLAQTNHRPLVLEPGKSVLSQLDEDAGDHATRFHVFVTDSLGTPTELVTPDGSLGWQHRTTVWGTDLPAAPDADAVHCPLRFPGQYHDSESGFHYNYFRIYDPETAQYLTPDPLGLEAAPNPVAYVRNPYTWADVLGLAPDCSTVWKDIKATQPNYPGTELPRSFEMQAGEHRVWVHGNASKHINEYVQGRIADGVGPQQAKIATQANLKSLQAAVEDATQGGVPLNRMVEVDGWELKFSQRPEDALPALVHALYTG